MTRHRGTPRSVGRDRRARARANKYAVRYCWCGELQGHVWPGKSAGAPHPGGADAPPLTPDPADAAVADQWRISSGGAS